MYDLVLGNNKDNTKLRVLFFAPHLSTGGMPQYLLRSVQELVDLEFRVAVVEYAFIAPGYEVQRKQLAGLLGDLLITLTGETSGRLKALKSVLTLYGPDVVHLQEVPEMWLPYEIASWLYRQDRNYKIIETSHDAGFDVDRKTFLPDGFAFISQYHVDKYAKFGVPYVIAEYPIVRKQRPDRESVLKSLGLDVSKKHVLNVGLFTSRKNQAEVVEVANKLLDLPIEFHFVGNQAGNFESYWRPLVDNKPPNCTYWGERADVETFYGAMDLFYFASKGTKTDLETNPLVLKEALGWDMEVLMRRLDVYCGMYDNIPKVHYIDDDIGKTCGLVVDLLGLENKPIQHRVHAKDFVFSYTAQNNKIGIVYNGTESRDVTVVVRDMDSWLTMYVFDLAIRPGFSWWVIPVPVAWINFQESSKFNGFVLEFYDKQNKLQFSYTLRLKTVEPASGFVFDFDPFELGFFNFMEFFHRGLFKDIDFPANGVVVDVGANIGMFTAYAFSRGVSKVIAVEPGKKALECLHKAFGDDDRVVIVDKAVASSSGTRELYSVDRNSPVSSLIREHIYEGTFDGGEKFATEVQTVRFDDLMNELKVDHIDMLKMDIEGAEYEVFESMSDTTLQHIDSVILEFHHNQNGNLARIKQRLEHNGLVCELGNSSRSSTCDLTAEAGCLCARRVGL